MSYTKAMFEDQIVGPVLKITSKTIEDNDYTEILNKIDITLDIRDGLKQLNPKIEELWNELTSDVLASVYSASSGFYRHAILALRSVLELGCNTFYYLDHNIEYEMFIKYNTKADKYVSSLVNEYAFFTTKYISTFFPDIDKIQVEQDSISNYLKILYGDLSDIVHGRYNSLTKKQTLQIKYSKSEFKSYERYLDRVLSILCTMYVLRLNEKSNQSIVKQAKFSRTVKL
ncbi:hypothetical protein P9H28_09620 [Paenibacillus barengoltzii]|uniref:hypothetical protein n=1 Tax=Paenibacillus barengoltzii TaxID=343517 RepID=UPI002DB959B5|nr:hypothetical protein [Paenibacillus barengoltzii]MEC2344347.1 hypothetical protein [Paenibacillus barengoltzii]